MTSRSYKDFKRYLEATNRLGKVGERAFAISGSQLFLVPHAKESLFDELPVSQEIWDTPNPERVLYGVSHKDGVLYVQSLKKLMDGKFNQVDDDFMFPKEAFVDVRKLIPNPDENKFVHLHCHTEYSNLDGMAKCEDYARRCKQLGFTAIAITDHGNMAGTIDFYKSCKKYGIKPIIGQEFYLDDNRFIKGAPEEFKKSIKKGENKRELTKAYEQEHRINLKRHICLFASNEKGLRNLYRLSSLAFSEGFYYKPRIDWELLERYNEGILCSTACVSGIIAAETDERQRLENLRNLVRIFGKDRLYLEAMLIDYEQQPAVNDMIFEYSEKYDIPAIVTVDSHFVDRDVDHIHHLYMKIGAGFVYGEGDNYLKTYKELMHTFRLRFSNCKYGWEFYEKATQKTLEFADRCNVEIELGKFSLPSFDLSTASGYREGETKHAYINRRVIEGWRTKIVPKVAESEFPKYKKQLIHEMKVYTDAGYLDYMLIVLDVCDWAKTKKILYNIRGSAAGSLVCYLLDITRVNPIKRGLIFERFVSPLRAGLVDKSYQSPPDIDMDFGNRDIVIDYLENKYGKSSVARIGTYNRLKLRAALKAAAKITGYMDEDQMNKMTTKINKKADTFEKAKDDKVFSDWYSGKKNKAWFDKYVMPITDLIGHGGMHAAGVALVSGNLIDYMPMKMQEKKKEKGEAGERRIITQFEGDSVEDIGILKLDVLGVNTLNSLAVTKELLDKSRGIDLDFDKIDLDKSSWYQNGFVKSDTVGIFQLDTDNSNRFCQQSIPETFFELMATISLSRPGTAGPGLDLEYCNRKKGSSFQFDHPLFKNFLSDSYGIAVFQEDVMRIANEVGGMSLVEADKIRKVMKKKDVSEMKSYQEKFIAGALQRGCNSREEALKLWKNIESWSGYGFCRAHAASYAQLSVWGMAMKTLCPLEFYVGLLQCADKKDYLERVYKDVKQKGIDILMPHVNHSGNGFIIKDGKIVWTLSSAKNVGTRAAEMVYMNAPYRSIQDLTERTEKKVVNKKVIDALICINAFHAMYPTQRDAAIDYYSNVRKETIPPEFDVQSERYWDRKFYDRMGFHEKDPQVLYQQELKKLGRLDTYDDFRNSRTLNTLKMAGYIKWYKKINSKRGEMAIMKIEVDYSIVAVVIWSSFFEHHYIAKMTQDEIIDSFVFVFGDKNKDPQGRDQVTIGDPNNDGLEFIG